MPTRRPPRPKEDMQLATKRAQNGGAFDDNEDNHRLAPNKKRPDPIVRHRLSAASAAPSSKKPRELTRTCCTRARPRSATFLRILRERRVQRNISRTVFAEDGRAIGLRTPRTPATSPPTHRPGGADAGGPSDATSGPTRSGHERCHDEILPTRRDPTLAVTRHGRVAGPSPTHPRTSYPPNSTKRRSRRGRRPRPLCIKTRMQSRVTDIPGLER